MSLRYRLFLWVSGVFVVVAACSYFLENFVTRRELAKAQKIVREKILDMSEKRRTDLQSFLAAAIAESEVRVDAVLGNISSFSPQVLRFGPTLANEKNGTWGNSADLLLDYKWIDFIQNTNEGQTTSAIIPQQGPIDSAYRIDIDQDLCWIYLGDLKTHPTPYFAVKLPYTPIPSQSHVNESEVPEQVSGVVPAAFLLFEVQDMLNVSMSANSPPILQSSEKKVWEPIPVKWTEGFELELESVVIAFQRGMELLRQKKIQPPQLEPGEVLEKMDGIAAAQGGKLSPIPVETLLSTVQTEKVMKDSFEEVSLRYAQISMIWALIAVYDSGVFGNHLFSFPTPSAVTLFGVDNDVGIGINTREVLFQTPVFDDKNYSQNNTSAASNLGSSLAVIPSPVSSHVYLGNTAQFIVKTPTAERVGYLTIGSDADGILQRLVLATHQAAILVHGGKPLSAYGENGEKIRFDGSSSLPFAQMLTEKSGIVSWNKENYFYVHIQPFPGVDLNFILLNPEDKEFALLHDLETGSQDVVDTILLNIHIAGFVALFIVILLMNNISRRVTKPIIQLANATGDVVEGRLDQIKLKLPPLKYNDEIAVLCHSFEEMVKGLQEKEKVKGVLNKVVSREIAQEILKGSVHLGGEEKKVTVLFADIRDFTKMTQNMQPQEVIEMLNSCMTKISYIIDKNAGVIDKYVGDEAMALFGAPISSNEAAFKAIVSAVEMVEALKAWNAERVPRGQPAIEMGIGIHSGQMLAGNMGAENRLNYTVIGSNVNLAARLCNAAKRMEILITKDTLGEPLVKERVLYEAMPATSFKGFDMPVEIFRVQGIKK